MPPDDVISHIPQQWVGIFAVMAFFLYVSAQLVEKYSIIAKHVPLGRWWHNRQNRKPNRGAWVAEDNEVIIGLQSQITTIAADLVLVNEKLRVFTAWSVYDARYHHRLEVTHADTECYIPNHHDFFEFERLWKIDPVAAAIL